MRTSNPIRDIVDRIEFKPHPTKKTINCSIGDPTVFGNFSCPEVFNQALIEAIRSGSYNGYTMASGLPETKEAVARLMSTAEAPLTPDDVFVTSGCSHALEFAMGVVANEGQNILVPEPCFPLYTTLADNQGIQCRYYCWDPQDGGQIDTDEMLALADSNTAAILINSPSNPCGLVLSKSQLQDICKVAAALNVPIISDEIYADMVFSGVSFHPVATLTSSVPVLTVGGIAKRYMVPGWRCGWVLVHDTEGALSQVREGLRRLANLIVGPNTLVQAAIPAVLSETPEWYHEDNLHRLELAADYLHERLSVVKGLKPVRPQGAMYLVCGIDMNEFTSFETELQFVQQLLDEEAVFVLPGECFRLQNFFRMVLTPPMAQLEDACNRIANFAARHTL